MTNRDRDREIAFLEHIARKAWLNMNYANAVETSLLEGQLSHLILERISKEEIKQLEDAAENAQKKLAGMLGVAAEMNFNNTLRYLKKLQKDLPKGQLSLVNLVFGGDPKKAAEKVGKITDIVNKIQRIEDSFKDAVVLFGSQLKKLKYSEAPEEESTKAAKLAADESDSGNVVIDGEDLGPPEDVAIGATKAFTDSPIKDLAANKFMTWWDGIKFPDLGTLEKAAKNSYKPPPEPEGFLGKLGALVGYGELGAGNFAKDMLSSPLSKIIAKADEWEATAAEEPEEVGGNVADDLQALGQGDASVVGGDAGSTTTQTVNVPGVGSVPASAIQTLTPGTKTTGADDLEGRDLVSIDDLERKVTEPEDVAAITPELAGLINDDPKSRITIFDPEEAEGASTEAYVEPLGSGEEPSRKTNPEDVTREAWVHARPLTDTLFESMSRVNKVNKWVYRTSLQQALLPEAIMYNDVEKSIRDQGVADDRVVTVARDLAKRLQNQYDVIITGIPSEDIKQAAQAAAGESDNLGTLLSYLEKRDASAERQFDRYMDDVGMSRQQTLDFTQAIADGNMQAAVDVAKEAGVNARAALDAAVEMSAEIEIEEEEVATSTSSSEEKTGEGKKKPGKKPGKPTQAMIDRAKKVGVEVKPTDNTDSLGGRVRTKERAEGVRPPAKKKPAKKKDKPAAERQKPSEEQTRTTRRVRRRGRAATQKPGFGTFTQQESAYYKQGRLTEVLLGPKPKQESLEAPESFDVEDRWAKLAGLENE